MWERNNKGQFVKGQPAWNNKPETLIERICQSCNKRFLWKARPSRIKAGYGKFCSKSCGVKFWAYTKRPWEVLKGKIAHNKGKPLGFTPKMAFKKNDPRISGKNNLRWKDGISLQKGYATFQSHKRRIRKVGAIGSHTLRQWQDLKVFYNFMCLCCKRFEPGIKLTEDHIVPLIMGGSDYIKNIQPLCVSCNSIKNKKTIDYREEKGLILTPYRVKIGV